MNCTYDPMEMAGMPIGMYHCPECLEMVIAGIPHPDYSLLDDYEEEDFKLFESRDSSFGTDTHLQMAEWLQSALRVDR